MELGGQGTTEGRQSRDESPVLGGPRTGADAHLEDQPSDAVTAVGEVRRAVPQKLTVVLPTRNEIDNLAAMVAALRGLSIPGVEVSVLVVDSESPDGTGDLADQLAARDPGYVDVLHVPLEGLCRAYMLGFARALEAGAELLVQMDCDFSHDPEAIVQMVDTMREQRADVVIGSRWIDGGTVDKDWPMLRQLLSRFANHLYVRGLMALPIADATGGFRLWRRQALVGMDIGRRIGSKGYIFQVEMASLAYRLGYRLAEIPIAFGPRLTGESKLNAAIQIEAAWRVLLIRLGHLLLSPAQRTVDWHVQRREAARDKKSPRLVRAATGSAVTP